MNSTVNALALDLSDNLYAGGIFRYSGIVRLEEYFQQLDGINSTTHYPNSITITSVTKINTGTIPLDVVNLYSNNKFLFSMPKDTVLNVSVASNNVAYANNILS